MPVRMQKQQTISVGKFGTFPCLKYVMNTGIRKPTPNAMRIEAIMPKYKRERLLRKREKIRNKTLKPSLNVFNLEKLPAGRSL